MDERMDEYITKHFRGMDVFGNVGGGAVVKWVRSLHTKVALLWESQGQTREGEEGKQRKRGGTPKPFAPIMDINNIHTELAWKLG